MREQQFGSLKVRLTGGTDREGGGDGPLVVLMHGFGAPGTDLVGLWRVLDVPRDVRFAFPEAPESIPGMPGARAWWMLDLAQAEQALASGPRSYATVVPDGMEDATDRVVEMVDGLKRELGVPDERLILGGFSQGSMAACNATFTREVSPRGLVILSGTPVHLTGWADGMDREPRPSVLQSHGEADPLLSFEAAEQLRDAMVDQGLEVRWVPFHGGHELPMPVIHSLSAFVRDVFDEGGRP
ncbi:MAG: phospholipase [Myxococcota bacterium]